MLSPALQSTIFGVLTKTVGSGFRILDDKQANAPPPVLKTTIRREGILVLLTTAFTSMVQSAFTRKILPRLEHTPLAPYELVFRALASCGGVALAEIVSRTLAPTARQRYTGAAALNPGQKTAGLNCISTSNNTIGRPLPIGAAPLKEPVGFAQTFPTRAQVSPSVYRKPLSV